MSIEMNKHISERANYLRIALALQGIGVSAEIADRIDRTYGAIQLKGGEFSLKDAAEIEAEFNDKWARIKIEERKEKSTDDTK
jgi:hypothetical protein